MPSYKVTIELNEDAPYVSGARFLSYLAYPDPRDAQLRHQFGRAIQAWAIHLKAAEDPTWALQPQWIMPHLIALDQQRSEKTRKQGYARICDRFLCAHGILFPAIRALASDRQITPQEFQIINQIFPVNGWKTESVSTFKSQVWKPSRPVTPAAGALLNWMLGRGLSAQTARHLWVDLLFSVQYQQEILDSAEEYRLVANEIRRYQLRDDQTVSFEMRSKAA